MDALGDDQIDGTSINQRNKPPGCTIDEMQKQSETS